MSAIDELDEQIKNCVWDKLCSHFGARVASHLYVALMSAVEGTKDYNIDNFRFAAKDNAAEVAAYEQAKNKGCCGFFDGEVNVDEKTFLFGFNYGH